MNEINPENQALTQLRAFWDKIIVILMWKAGLKEITIDSEDVAPLLKNPPVICVLGRKALGEDKGFTILLANSREEMLEALATHQGKG